MPWVNDTNIKTVERFLRLLSVRDSRRQIRRPPYSPAGNSVRGISDASDALEAENRDAKAGTHGLKGSSTALKCR